MNELTVEAPGFLLGELSAYQSGQFPGQAVIWIALLAGAAKCWSISRRPNTNAKCVRALMLVLLGFVGCSAVGTLPRPGSASPALGAVVGLLSFGAVGSIIAAIVLAILGLREQAREPGRFVQGRAQAIWALSLVGFVGLLVVFGAVQGATRTRNLAAAPDQPRPGQYLRFDELNFQFRTPDRPWVAADAAKFNKQSQVAFIRHVPESYFLIVAERFGASGEVSSEQLAEVGKAHLRGAAASVRILREAPFNLNGLEGVLVETEAQVQTLSLYYQQWFCATNGFAYQLSAYGRAGERQRLAADLRTLFSRFEILDPRRVAVVAGGGFATNFVSARYSYTVSLTNSPWRPYASLEKQAPEAEFGASRGDTCFVVTPVWLGGQRLEPDALASAFLATFGIAYPNEKLTRRRALVEGDLNGVQYDFTREVQGMPLSYRFKLLQGNGDGFLVAAWTQRREAESEAALADALERVRFLPRAVPLGTTNRDFLARERKTQGNLLNQAALFYYNSGNYEKALALFCAAARVQAEESLYVLNALQAWRHLDRPKEALAFLEAQPPASLNLPNIRAWQAYFQAQVSLTDQALTNYAGLFASGFRNDTHFVEYIGLLNLQRQYDQALAEVAAYLKKEDSIPVRLLEAEIYTFKKDYPKALSLLQALHDKVPFNAQVTKNLAEVSLQAGRFNTALEISRELLQQNGDSASAYYYKGRSELGLKWYREAKASFEAAAKLAPANKDIGAYLEHVSGLIGEGSNSAIKEPIEMVALPSTLTNTVLEPAPEGYAKSYGAYYLRRATALSWKPRAECKTTESFLAKVLDASGVAAFSTVQFPFDPLSEQVFVNELRVMDAAGNTVSVGKVADYYVLDDPSGNVASQKKVLNIPVPGLQPGGQLAMTITRRQLGRLEEFPFFEHAFSRAFPVRESIFYFCGDAAGVTCRTAPALEPCQVAQGRYWRILDPVVARWEPMQPPATTYLPMLWIGDATARWPALASNYLASIRDRLELDPALRELARTLTAESPTRDAKIARLTRFVQTNCTYKAIEFGRRARIPNKPAQVFHNQYGDCKDHAVLLQQLLQAVDLPAHLALVSHHAPVRQDLPSLDQFDHMIVFVPEAQEGRFIDCTLKGADAARDIPLGLAGREALILQSQNPHFATIPGYAEGASTCDLQRQLQLVNLTDVAVEETLTLTGVHAAYLRNYLLQFPPTSQRQVWQRYVGAAGIELTRFQVEPLEQPDAPLQVRYAYTLKQQFHRTKERVSGVLRADTERSYLGADPVENRSSPFELTIPFTFRCRISMTIPAGFHPEPLDSIDAKLDPRFARSDCQVRWDQSRLNLEFQCRRLAGHFKAADYAAYRETMAQALSLLERELIFKAGNAVN